MEEHSEFLSALELGLAPAGLNLFGVADVATYDVRVAPERRSDKLLPGCRSVIVVGSGGSDLWRAMKAAIVAEPKRLTSEPHPLDAFVRREIEAIDARLPAFSRRWFYAAAEAEPQLDFRVLAQAAGLGSKSRLGLLIHPFYGPWVGLRAACFVEVALHPSAAAPHPCIGCPAPCIAACPAQALRSGEWDVDVCSTFHAESDRCDRTCHSRVACPVGNEHRYPPDEMTYHYDRAAGRRALRVLVPTHRDVYEGQGPLWQTWRARVRVGS